jgi:hypothetical protein
MRPRFSPDRRFFKQSLSALLRRVQSLAPRLSALDRIDPQWLPDLLRIRQEIKSDNLDRNAVIFRVVKLAQRLVGASGAGVWLLSDDDIFYCEGAGNASNDERLRLEVLSELATSCRRRKHSPTWAGEPTTAPTVCDARYGPVWAKSLILEPICQGKDIAGMLAVFSAEANAFGERDVAHIHLLADLLAQSFSKAVEMGLEHSVALEPAAVLQLIARIVPALQRMVESDERYWGTEFSRGAPERDFTTPGAESKSLPESYESIEIPHVAEATGGSWTEQGRVAPASAGDSAARSDRSDLGDKDPLWIGERAALERAAVESSTLFQTGGQRWARAVAHVRNCTSYALEVLNQAVSGLLTRVGRVASRGLRRVHDSFLPFVKRANSWIQVPLHFEPRMRTLGRAVAPVLAILAMIATFLILKTGLPHTAQNTASNVGVTAAPGAAPLGAGGTGYVETVTGGGIAKANTLEANTGEQPAPLQVSHMRITDRATEAAVRTLSRYELAGLHRRAEFGDDSAALQLGMAYEIGHVVSQSCITATRWIARAAAEDNAAAQYNLGLRYRDGDGVPVNEDEAVKWLQRAATHRSPDARRALIALTANQSPSYMPSHP